MRRPVPSLLAGLLAALAASAGLAAGDPFDVGEPAPGFALPDQAGESRRLEGSRGQWLVPYSYPGDDMPGCTTEACRYRDNING
jgi:peroxiredoxin Q/BCP